MAILDQALNNIDDGIHGFGRTRVYGRLFYAKTLCINEILLDIALGDGVEVHTLLVGLVDDLVVNVGKVLHELDLITAVLEVTAQ